MAPCAPANITRQMHLVRASVVLYSSDDHYNIVVRSDHIVITMVFSRKRKQCIQAATNEEKEMSFKERQNMILTIYIINNIKNIPI